MNSTFILVSFYQILCYQTTQNSFYPKPTTSKHLLRGYVPVILLKSDNCLLKILHEYSSDLRYKRASNSNSSTILQRFYANVGFEAKSQDEIFIFILRQRLRGWCRCLNFVLTCPFVKPYLSDCFSCQPEARMLMPYSKISSASALVDLQKGRITSRRKHDVFPRP